jgi:adenylate cyclase
LVMQVADVVLNNVEAPGWVFSVIMLLLGLGLPFAIFFSWAFELTPEGLKLEKDVDRTQSITPHTGKKLNNMIFAFMALALAYFVFDKFVLDASRDAAMVEAATQAGAEQAGVEDVSAETDQSIAVLPFVNMSSDEEQEYFSDGLSEELLNLLAKIPELRVIARTSSFAYKGKDIQIADVAKELNVEHVLEGSVRKAGNQVRITAQLIRASDSSHLWSETYDRSLEDIFAIQDEISSEVVAQLKVTLLGEQPRVREIDPEAYALFLQGRHVSRQRTPEAWEQGIVLHQQALEITPDYAAAWVELGGIYQNQAGRSLRSVDEGLTLAQEAVDNALAADRDFAPAYALRGWLAMYFENDLATAALHFERALKLEPGDLDSLNQAATLLHNLGRMEQAISIQKYILARDPVNSRTLGNMGLSFISTGRPDEALTASRTAIRLNPSDIGAQTTLGNAHLLKGEPEAALAAMLQESFEPYRLVGLVLAHHALGQKSESDAVLIELIDKHEEGWSYNIAYTLAYRGEADRAFEWLAKAVEYKDAGLAEIPTQIEFANIHGDPRWLAFLESIGKSPAQLDAIEFNVTLPDAS